MAASFKIVDDSETGLYQKLRPLAADDDRVQIVEENRSYVAESSSGDRGGIVRGL